MCLFLNYCRCGFQLGFMSTFADINQIVSAIDKLLIGLLPRILNARLSKYPVIIYSGPALHQNFP